MKISDRRRAYIQRYQRERRSRLRSQWIKENGPCKECGSTEDLEMDHIDPSHKVHHCIWSWSPERRAAETAKCQVLCKKCHLKKTIAACVRSRHGSKKRYVKYKCRCELCVTAYRERRRAENARYLAKKIKKNTG